MDATKLTKEIFLDEVKSHAMTIIKEDGLYRHLRFAALGTSNQYFEIITWPGYLAYVGDMGDFLFTRTQDMFGFFRNKEERIDTAYWAEKVVAESVHTHGIREFSVEAFRENVLDDARGYLNLDEGGDIPKDIMEELGPLLRAEDEWECVTAMRDFSSEKISFDDFWEHSCQRKTWHYVWCCYAILWAIAKYDEAKEK